MMLELSFWSWKVLLSDRSFVPLAFSVQLWLPAGVQRCYGAEVRENRPHSDFVCIFVDLWSVMPWETFSVVEAGC
jgi:hypothetical protein